MALSDLINALEGNFTSEGLIDSFKQSGDEAFAASQAANTQVQQDVEFQPFSVSGPLGGGFSVDQYGGGTFNAGQDALSQNFLGGAQQFASAAGVPIGTTADQAREFLQLGSAKAGGTSMFNDLIRNGGLGSGQDILNQVTGFQGARTPGSMIDTMTGFQGRDAGGVLDTILGLSGGAGREASLMNTLAGSGLSQQDRDAILGLRSGEYDPSRGTTAADYMTGFDQGGRESSLINMIQGGGTQAREQDVFNRLEALAQPERERQNLALEERLFTQGRGGVRDARFGGTPEQLALAKAQQESVNQNAVSAIEQARADQALRGQQVGQGLDAARADTALTGQLRGQGLGLGLQEQGQRDSSLMQALGLGNQMFGLTSQNRAGAVDAAIRERLGMSQTGLGAFGQNLQERLGFGGMAQGAFDTDLRERLGLGQLGLGSYDTGIRQQGVLGELGLGSFDSQLRENIADSETRRQAYNVALANQAQTGNLASNFLQSAYTPMNQQMGLLSGFGDLANIANTNRRQGVSTGAGLLETGLQSQLESIVGAGNIQGAQQGALASIIGSVLSNSVGRDGGFLDNLLGGLF